MFKLFSSRTFIYWTCTAHAQTSKRCPGQTSTYCSILLCTSMRRTKVWLDWRMPKSHVSLTSRLLGRSCCNWDILLSAPPFLGHQWYYSLQLCLFFFFFFFFLPNYILLFWDQWWSSTCALPISSDVHSLRNKTFCMKNQSVCLADFEELIFRHRSYSMVRLFLHNLT